LPAVFSAESLGGDLLAHAHSIGQTARGPQPSALACDRADDAGVSQVMVTQEPVGAARC
jgi:hypothetical protein